MAHRFEKEANGEYALVIDGWENGIGLDPYSGMHRMYGVDLETKGEVAVGYPITQSNTSGGTLTAPVARSVAWFAAYGSASGNGSPSFFAILDDSGEVFQSTSVTGTFTYLATGSTLTGASSRDGIAYYLGYLFKFRNGSIDYYDGSTWHNNWHVITGGIKHFAYVATDNTLYFTNGNFIGSIGLADPSNPSSFDPATPATYVFTAQKLQIPQNDFAISMCEVGGGSTPQSTLLVGGIQNAIYPWDKTAVSFNFPIYVADSYIVNLVSANQNAFIFTGNASGRGRIYITNGAQASLFFKMPDYLFGEQDPYYEWGDAIFHRNNLIFGCLVDKNSGSGVLSSANVWAITLGTAGLVPSPVESSFRAISLINGTVANATVLMSSYNLSVPGFGFIMGWKDTVGPTFGIGYSGTTAGIGNANITTDLMAVGTFLQKKTFKQVEFKLRSPLLAGESIAVTPIVDGGTNTTALSFQPTITTGSISGVANVTFQANQWLQFSVNLQGNGATSGVRLKEIRLR